MSLQLKERGGYWYIWGQSQGVTIRRSTRIALSEKGGKRRAQELLAACVAEVHSGALGRDEVLVEKVIASYLPRLAGRHHQDTVHRIVGPHKHKSIAEVASEWPDIRDQYVQYVASGRYRPASINYWIGRWRAIFRIATKRGWLDANVLARMDLSSVPDEQITRALTADQLSAVISAADDWVKPHLVMLASTGLRVGELLRLRSDDVDLQKRVAYIGKTKTRRDRYAPLNDDAMWAVRQVWQGGVLFRDHTGVAYKYSTERGGYLKAPLDRACKRAGVPCCRVHDLRHTYATALVRSGANLAVVQKAGGWSSLSLVQRYAAADLDMVANAVGGLRIASIREAAQN